MRSRSQIHMLVVAAARVAEAGGDPEMVKALRAAAGLSARKKARGEDGGDHDAAERTKQTERHRTLFNVLPDSREKTRLEEAMLQFAYDLMWEGNCAGVDSITEFLPSDDVKAMFGAWEQDMFGDKPKSKWYGDNG